jgi:thioredoxin reductase (NADPH)
MMNVLVLEGSQPGGQLTTTSEIENFPGVESSNGYDLVEKMKEQASTFGAKFVYKACKQLIKSDESFSVQTDDECYKSKTVIVATGARPRKLGLEFESKYWSKGISSCATCDGFFFRKKETVVIGGGDSAMEEAIFLTKFCSKVTIIHRRETLRASKIMADRAMKNPKIHWKWNTIVEEVLGDEEKVTGLRLRNVKDDTIEDFNTSGMFLGIGHIPNTDFLRDLEPKVIDDEGYGITTNDVETTIPGLFMAGDCVDKVYRQAVTAAGEGCKASLQVEWYLERL